MSGQGRGTPRVNPVATSAVVIGDVTVDQGTSPWIISGSVTQGTSPWVVSGTVTANQGTSPWVISGAVTQGTSPWVISGAVTQGTSPWVVSGTVAATQSTSPWVVSGTVTANQGTAAALASAWPIKLTDGTNTMPTADVASRAMFNKITDGTITITMGLQARANSFPIVKKIESVRSTLTGTIATSQSSASTAQIMGTVTGLDDYESFAIEATLAGTDGTVAGGSLDFVVQCSPDGTNWTDWFHFPTVASAAAAVSYRAVPTFSGTITVVTLETGTGTTIGLGSGLSSGGHPGNQVRLKSVSGSGVNHAITQTVFLIATRPAQS